MKAPGGRTNRSPKKSTEKPSLTCAICKRRYQTLRMPGLHTVYSICPDCRLDVALPAQEKN